MGRGDGEGAPGDWEMKLLGDEAPHARDRG